MAKAFLERLSEGVILCDGAMGTRLHSLGASAIGCFDELNLSDPDLVSSVHSSYKGVGSEILETNTFGANPIRLSGHGLDNKTLEINQAGAKLARKVMGNSGYVAGSVGPTGKMMEPYGKLTFSDAKDAFKMQIQGLVDGRVDAILIETMSDLREARAAIQAAREICDLPILCQMSFPQDGCTMMGVSPESAVVALLGMGVDVIGANCGSGPAGMLDVVRVMASMGDYRISAQPNAGMPQYVDGRFLYLSTPAYLAEYARRFVEAGATLIGGCCGTTPEHIAAMAEAIKDLKPEPRKFYTGLRLSSRHSMVSFTKEDFPIVVGSRINPRLHPELSQKMGSGYLDGIENEARDQVEAGARILNIKASKDGQSNPHLISQIVERVQEVVDVPLSIEFQSYEELESALQVMEGRGIINQMDADPEKLSHILPLASKYGAAVLAVTRNSKGVPTTAEERVDLARLIIAAFEQEGLSREDLLLDCMTEEISGSSSSVTEGFRAMEIVQEKLGVRTFIRVGSNGSNILAPLTLACSHGVSAVILDSLDEKAMKFLHTAREGSKQF